VATDQFLIEGNSLKEILQTRSFPKELNMELLDRYLQAVEFWLPKRQRQDIIAELSEDLRSQIEEKETELGRKLNDAEVEEILNRCGAPMTVASRYRPQQFLIGPTLFPIYRFVLGVLLIGCIVPRFLLWLGFLLLDPADRGYLHMDNLGTTVLYFAFFTTLVFAIMERSGVNLEINTWNPRKLPAVRDPDRIPRSAPLAEIAIAIIFNVWFITALWPRPSLDLGGVQIALAPQWRLFFWSFLLVAAANIVLASVNLYRAYWTSRRATFRLILDTLGGGLFCWLLKAQVVLGISSPNMSEAKAVAVTALINTWIARTLPWAVVVTVVIICFDVYRILRLRGVCRHGSSTAPAAKSFSKPMVNGN
jgi:hypothetical protein